jgi:leader peptidase (prepilin peptidase) / N-methyltransferase
VLPRLLLDLYAVLLGLIIGSFLNVLVHRLPRGRSFVLPRSRCPWCGGVIAARDNLPIVSWLLLRGRCRKCSAPISPRYPLVEAATALLFLACLERFGATAHAAAAAIFCALLLALAVTDIEHLLLPDGLTFPGMATGLALQPWLPPTAAEALVGMLAGAGALFLIAELWLWLRGEEGMGLGDAKLLAMVGAFLGWQGALLSLFFGVVVGAALGIALLVAGRRGWKSRLPFGTFLALGALVALFTGNGPLDRYLRLL